ncbi:MAG: hypothetical protein FWE24_09940 [Defluviitaleaceae bacterium]|nr:hypothetical protein [Defluviitaleaceae bacterium]
MSLAEHEYKLKERRLKGVIAVLLVICIVSVAVNVINARRAENIRQIYMSSIWSELDNLEVLLGSLNFVIENEYGDLKISVLESLRSTTNSIDMNITRLSSHQNFRGLIPGMWHLDNHIRSQVHQILDNRATPVNIAAFQSFLTRRQGELGELIADLTLEWEEEWWGERVTISGPNTNMSTRQFFNRLRNFTASVDDEVIEHIRLQNLNHQVQQRVIEQ